VRCPSSEPAQFYTDRVMADLNPDQYEAVHHTGGPLLVVAGAGSGKTRVLTQRIAWLISSGVHPMKILAITFTNKAADEMRHRVSDLVGPVANQMWVSTFHKACVRILRAHADRIGYPKTFSIYDSQDSKRLVGYVIRDLGLDPRKFPAQASQGRISLWKNELISADRATDIAESVVDRKHADVYREYQDRLLRAGAMDFDDLLVNVVRLFESCPDILDMYQQRFEHVLIDEYQDTNYAQNKIVLMLEQHTTMSAWWATPTKVCIAFVALTCATSMILSKHSPMSRLSYSPRIIEAPKRF
jgi:DNA helicase II / ATP-dependent DNA helicase PcrA